MSFNSPTFKQTGHQDDGKKDCRPCAFDEELELCKGISRPHTTQFEKGQALMGVIALKCNGQDSNHFKTLSSAGFYTSHGEGDKLSKDDKQSDRFLGKRDRATSISTHNEITQWSFLMMKRERNRMIQMMIVRMERHFISMGCVIIPEGKKISGLHIQVEVQQSDLKHLDPFEFLNDTIIDFYIKYLQRPENMRSEKKANIHFFNTFFFKKLLLEKRKKKRADYHSKLRKWTKGINIFDKTYLLVPVHDSAHWSLAIVCFSMEKKCLKPYILHLDSMREGHVSEEVFHVLKSYLELEWQMHSTDDSYASGSFNLELGEFLWKRVEVPLQQNAWDCGLFLLYYIECFLQDVDGRFKPSSLKSMFGRDWFKPQKASNLRQHIRLVLEDLKQNNIHEITMEDKD